MVSHLRVKQLQDLLDEISLDGIGMKDRIRNEEVRFNRFQRSILRIKGDVEVQDIDVRNYAKYILRDGRDYEKKRALGCFRSKLFLSDKKVYLEGGKMKVINS